MIALLGLWSVQTDAANLNCVFSTVAGYSCQITGAVIADDVNQEITIGGQHLTDRSNADVRSVRIINSQIPFIVTQIFTTFPNVVELVVSNGGLIRVQPYAFANASRLFIASIRSNPLTDVQAYAFSGATSLEILDVFVNQLETIHSTAFNGLPLLTELMLDQNRLRSLDPATFNSLPNLEIIYLDENLIETLDGNIFANNPMLRTVSLGGNQINAVGREFLDSMANLRSLNMMNNRCVSSFWIVGGVTSLETVRLALQTCFNNFD